MKKALERQKNATKYVVTSPKINRKTTEAKIRLLLIETFQNVLTFTTYLSVLAQFSTSYRVLYQTHYNKNTTFSLVKIRKKRGFHYEQNFTQRPP